MSGKYTTLMDPLEWISRNRDIEVISIPKTTRSSEEKLTNNDDNNSKSQSGDSCDDLLVELKNMPEFVYERMMPENLQPFTGHGLVKRVKCRLCDKHFRHMENLRHHFNNEHMISKLGIKRSNSEILSDSKQMRFDVEQHSGEIFFCPECDNTYTKKSSLSNHLKSHERVLCHGENENDAPIAADMFFCPVCNRSFSKQISLRNHLKSHANYDLHRENEVTTDSNIIDPSLSCPDCDKSFTKRSSLTNHIKSHMRPHQQEKSESDAMARFINDPYWNPETEHFECNLCHKSYSQKCHLTQHLNFHAKLAEREEYRKTMAMENRKILKTNGGGSDEKPTIDLPYQDSEMDVSSSNATNETKEKIDIVDQLYDSVQNKYLCNQCDKICYYRNHMTNHLKSHKRVVGGGGSFLANPRTAASDVLHTDDLDRSDLLDPLWNAELNMYQCNHCDKKCVYRNHMTNHLKKHANWNRANNRYECSGCEFNSIRRQDMLMHLKANRECAQICGAKTEEIIAEEVDEEEEEDEGREPAMVKLEGDSGQHDYGKYWSQKYQRFKCDQCRKTFQYRTQIILHIRSHEKHRREEVEFWRKLTNDNKLIDYDKLSNPGAYLFLNKYWNESLERFECDQCDKVYISRKPMTKHLWSHDVANNRSTIIETVFLHQPNQADVGENSSYDEDSDNNDNGEVNVDDEYSSDNNTGADSDSDGDSAAESDIDTSSTATTPKIYACKSCKQTFSRKTALKCHTQSAHKNRSMWITTSDGASDTKRNRNYTKSFYCRVCPKRFETRANLNHHVKHKHSIDSHLNHSYDFMEPEPPIQADYANDQEGFLRHFSLTSTQTEKQSTQEDVGLGVVSELELVEIDDGGGITSSQTPANTSDDGQPSVHDNDDDKASFPLSKNTETPIVDYDSDIDPFDLLDQQYGGECKSPNTISSPSHSQENNPLTDSDDPIRCSDGDVKEEIIKQPNGSTSDDHRNHSCRIRQSDDSASSNSDDNSISDAAAAHLQCFICRTNFMTPDKLSQHMQQMHNTNL